jgi:predicted transcriptional regulator
MKKKANLPVAKLATSKKPGKDGPGWTFLTNHSHVLLCLFDQPEMRLREVATHVGITERMVQKIVSELEDAGYLTIEKQGRCNVYRLHTSLKLRHPLEAQHSIGELLKLLADAN